MDECLNVVQDVSLQKGHPERIQIQLTHYKQKYNWDCGISCVLMVLSRKDRQNFIKNFNQICKLEGFNKSTWTIDLCYLLNRYKVEHVYYTVTLGVHPGYRGNSFYHHIYNKDESRINNRFKNAEENGICLQQASVTCSQILNHLIYGPVIILTNAKLLYCDKCKFNKISSELRKCFAWPSPYQGHYIVLCGYDINSQKIFYRNPSFVDHVCVMSLINLEEARKSYGTDEDVIFIFT